MRVDDIIAELDQGTPLSMVIHKTHTLSPKEQLRVKTILNDRFEEWINRAYKWNAQFENPWGEGNCAVCGYEFFIEKHHFVPKSKGGTDDPRNLIDLCPTHHRGIHFLMTEINESNLERHMKWWGRETKPDEQLFDFYMRRIEPLVHDKGYKR